MDKSTKTAKQRDRRSFTPEFKAEVGRHGTGRLGRRLGTGTILLPP